MRKDPVMQELRESVEIETKDIFRNLLGNRLAVRLKSGYLMEVVDEDEDPGLACLAQDEVAGDRCTRVAGHGGPHAAVELQQSALEAPYGCILAIWKAR